MAEFAGIVERWWAVDFGEGKKGVTPYALARRAGHRPPLIKRDGDVQLSVNDAGKGRAVYLSGLPYSPQNARLLHRAVMWASHAEGDLLRWFSSNPAVENAPVVHASAAARAAQRPSVSGTASWA